MNLVYTDSTHCKELYTYVFLFWELHGLSPNFHIHVSVSPLYIPRIVPHSSLQQNDIVSLTMCPNPGPRQAWN
jgi:hypothetical protein